jgi:UDP-2-acetamido-2,6-beta-L-arabino-hexul-4-ose reductase
MKVLITGANGFIGRNLQSHLLQRQDIKVVCFGSRDDLSQLPFFLKDVDFVFHLAGVNRPLDEREFDTGNVDLTKAICDALRSLIDKTGKKPSFIYTSSTQAEGCSLYGKSKYEAEQALFSLAHSRQVPMHVFRLPNVFGKWSKPNYNSVVATFCHNISRGITIEINDPSATLKLVYVDDVISRFLMLMDGAPTTLSQNGFESVEPQYETTLGALASQIESFKYGRLAQTIGHVGTGLVRALYATYVSFLPVESFAYEVPQHADARGVFVEMLKTPDAGQFSFFSAYPGVTRGGHYHHSKVEKFLVVRGKAHFRLRNILTEQLHDIYTCGDMPEVVETIPGWTHDITNIGKDEMVVILWANEIFDPLKHDTYSCPV